MTEKALYEAAKAIATTCPERTIADLLNCLLCVDAHLTLTDSEASAGQMLFDALCDACPNAISLAQSSDVKAY